MGTLYAWARPTPYADSPLDHTWVTDYDNRVEAYASIAAVIAADANYWFCWGDFHARAESTEQPQGFLGEAAADIAWAACLCESNALSATGTRTCGTIEHFGIDGVCHQLANQVLYASSGAGAAPLTVAKARGYGLSTFFYGTYGLRDEEWAARRAECQPGAPTMSRSNDEFESRAAMVLANSKDERTLATLLELRARWLAEIRDVGMENVPPTADEINARHRAYLREASAFLSEDEFRQLFDVAPAEIPDIELVDPNIASQLRPRPKAR